MHALLTTHGGGRSWALRTATFAVAALYAAPIASSQELTFRFAPPDGTAFVETSRISREVYMGQDTLPAEIKQGQTRYEIHRSGDGYLVRAEPVSPIDPRTATDAADLYRSILSQMNVAYILDADGKLVRTDGADEAMKAVRDNLPQELYDLAVTMLQGRTPSEILVADWNNRALLGAFVGQTVRADTTVVRTGPVAIPSGDVVEAETRIRHSRAADCGSGRCARSEVGYTSRSERLGDLMSGLLLRPLRQLLAIMDPTGEQSGQIEGALAQFRISSAQVTMEATRVTDLITGLPYADETTSTLTAVMEVPGGERAAVKLVERRRSSFQYER